jgi:hypothetical protein
MWIQHKQRANIRVWNGNICHPIKEKFISNLNVGKIMFSVF